MTNPFYTNEQNNLEAAEEALLHSASFNDPRLTSLIRMIAQGMNGGRPFGQGVETGLRHLLVGARSSLGVSDPSDMLSGIYSGLISRGGTLMTSGGAGIGGAYGRGFTSMGIAQQYANAWTAYSTNSLGGQSYAATAGLSYKQQGDIISQILREKGMGRAESISLGRGSAAEVARGFQRANDIGGSTSQERASQDKIIKLIEGVEKAVLAKGGRAGFANETEFYNFRRAEMESRGKALGASRSEIDQAAVVSQGGAKIDVVEKQAKEELTKAIKRTSHVVKELSSVFQETDFNKLQESVRELGLGSITAESNVKRMRQFIRNARTTAALTGKRVEDIVAEQVDIARGYGHVFGRRMSQEEIQIVQNAGNATSSTYDKGQRQAFAARNTAAAANLTKFTATAMQRQADLKSMGSSDAKLDSLIEAAQQATTTQERAAAESRIQAHLARTFPAALRAEYMQPAAEKYGGASAKGMHRMHFERNLETELRKAGVTGPEAAAALKLGKYAGTDEGLHDKLRRALKDPSKMKEAYDELKERGHNAYGLEYDEFQSMFKAVTPNSLLSIRNTALSVPHSQGLSNASRAADRQRSLEASKEWQGFTVTGRQDQGFVGNALLGLFSEGKDVSDQQLWQAGVTQAAHAKGITFEEELAIRAKEAGPGSMIALGQIADGRFANIEELAKSEQFLKQGGWKNAAEAIESNKRGAAVAQFADNTDMIVTQNQHGAVAVDRDKMEQYIEKDKKLRDTLDLLKGIPVGDMTWRYNSEGQLELYDPAKKNAKGVSPEDHIVKAALRDPEVLQEIAGRKYAKDSRGHNIQKSIARVLAKTAGDNIAMSQYAAKNGSQEVTESMVKKLGYSNITEYTDAIGAAEKSVKAGNGSDIMKLWSKMLVLRGIDGQSGKIALTTTDGRFMRKFAETNLTYDESAMYTRDRASAHGKAYKDSLAAGVEESYRWQTANFGALPDYILPENQEKGEGGVGMTQEDMSKALAPMSKDLRSIAEALQRTGPGIPVVIAQNNA